MNERDTHNDKEFPFLNSLIDFPLVFALYFYTRLSQIYRWFQASHIFFLQLISTFKSSIVKKMFWGRNSFYRKFFHFAILSIVFIVFMNSVSNKIANSFTEEKSLGVQLEDGAIGQNDTLEQISTIQPAIIREDNELPFPVHIHTVQKGETLMRIAKDYGLNDVATIQWANGLDPYSSKIKEGQELKIPPMKGVLKEASLGDTPETLIKGVLGANIFDVLEVNDLRGQDQPLAENQIIFIPNGDLPLPKISSSRRSHVPQIVDLAGDVGIEVPPGTFTNPVGDASCQGYNYSRGWSLRHTGVDLAKSDGCWIRSIAGGKVYRARWCAGGLGFCTIVKHDNGFSSLYAHGNGTFSVKEGETVSAGQKIMYMGCTGQCYGTHLHLSLAANGDNVVDYYDRINPKGLVPY